MSYEGHHQFLCANGHLWSAPENYGTEEYEPCPYCKAEIAFDNPVDDTNGDEYGVIPPEEWEKLLVSKAVYETCNLGHQHCTMEAVYRIPTNEEAQTLRHFWDWETKTRQPTSPRPGA